MHARHYLACLNLVSSSEGKQELKTAIERIQTQLNLAREVRYHVETHVLEEPSNEPIAKVINQGVPGSNHTSEWHPYTARLKNRWLHADTKRDTVVSLHWLLDAEGLCEVTLEHATSRLVVSPLRPATEVERDDEF